MTARGKQYAVIEVRWIERPSERFVISYSDEKSLRDLIADPNILACGFASHSDAEAHIQDTTHSVGASKPCSAIVRDRIHRESRRSDLVGDAAELDAQEVKETLHQRRRCRIRRRNRHMDWKQHSIVLPFVNSR
jgi:hypothetical protein